MTDISPPGDDLTWSDPPAYTITGGPKHHFFGYYDRCCFDGTGRYVLCLEASFADRQPGPEDTATVGVVDLEEGNGGFNR
jgi:hypothetical protein